MSNKALEKTSFGRPASLGLRLLGNPYGRQERLTGLFMVLPAFVFFVLFIGIPIVRTILLGFQKWDAITPPQWTGLENYAKLLNDSIFHTALLVTFVLTGGLTL